MTERIKNEINADNLILGMALAAAVFSFVLTWYMAFATPKPVSKPYLVITTIDAKTASPSPSTILIQNTGEAVAHNLVISVKYPAGAKITVLNKGALDLVEGGFEAHFVKLKKDEVKPGVSLPYILLAAQKDGKLIEPTLHAESREIPKIPIHITRETYKL